jgi:hypothetical protein
MQPTRALWRRGPDLLAADTTTLSQAANALQVHLAINNFAPGLDLLLASLTEATFPGYGAKNVGLNTQPVFYDAETGLLTIKLIEPAGGWLWQSTGVPAAAETIYGCYLTDNAGAILYGSQLLETPVTIDNTGQGIQIDNIDFVFSLTSPS